MSPKLQPGSSFFILKKKTMIDLIIENYAIGLAALLDMLSILLITQMLLSKGLINESYRRSLMLLNVIVYFFCLVLFRLEITVAAGLGLFAIFALLRFRSEVMSIEEMVFLFLSLALGFFHATIPNVMSWLDLIFLDIGILSAGYLINHKVRRTHSVKVKLSDLKYIKPQNRPLVRDYLQSKIGMKIVRMEVVSLNIENDTASLEVKFALPARDSRSVEMPRRMAVQELAIDGKIMSLVAD
jgi:hypothetical protein